MLVNAWVQGIGVSACVCVHVYEYLNIYDSAFRICLIYFCFTRRNNIVGMSSVGDLREASAIEEYIVRKIYVKQYYYV